MNNSDSSLTNMRASSSSAWEEMDEWGPEKVLHVYDPYTGMKGVLVIDNTSTGPGKGGIRFAESKLLLTRDRGTSSDSTQQTGMPPPVQV